MKREIIFRVSVLCLIAMLFITTGCQDKDYYDPSSLPDSEETASTLNFGTTRDVQLDFNSLLPEGLITAFNVYAENPYKKNDAGNWIRREDVKPIASGINVAGVSDLKRTLPQYVGELYVCPSTLFAPTLMYAKIENDRATFEEIALSNNVSEDVSTRTYKSKAVDHYLSPYLSRTKISGTYYYKPTVTLKKEDFPVSVKNDIAATFPNGKKAESKYYEDASIKIVQEEEEDEGAELWLSVIHSDGSFNNSLMYFCYNGDKELSELTEDEKNELHIISAFQFAKIGSLKDGEYIKLKYYDGKNYVDKFPLNTQIGWVLASDGFKVNSVGSIHKATTANNSTNNPWFYSVPSWNPEKTNKNHTISFAAAHKGKDYICFGFEDMNNEKGDGDCNDVMFHIIANPIKALIPPPYIPVEGTIEVTDTKTGILTFEDNWPRLGDYDLNDVVVKYASEITEVQNTLDGEPVGDVTLKRIIDKITIINDGASFDNAFSYKIGISLADIESVRVNGDDYTPYDDKDGFIIDLCANVKALTLPEEYTVIITFKEGTIKSDDFNSKKYPYGKAPYNPFIQPTNPSVESNAIEVHLPFYPPTGRADMNLFGKYSDASDKDKGIYYASPEDVYYPFALHLSEVHNFVIPVETKSIDYTYPKYMNWVNSGCGLIDADWYLSPTN